MMHGWKEKLKLQVKGGCAMALPAITDVQISEDGELYIYEVFVEKPTPEPVVLLLTEQRDTGADPIAGSTCEWFNTSGLLKIKKDSLSKVTDLYIYLKSQSSKAAGIPVRVYYEALTLRQWRIGDGRLFLLPAWGRCAYDYSRKLALYFTDPYGVKKCLQKELPDISVYFEQLNAGEETAEIKLQAAYIMEDEGAKICGAPCPEFTVYKTPPKITTLAVTGQNLVFTGKFEENVPVCIQIFQEGLIKEIELADGKADISDLGADPNQPVYVRACYRTDLGSSPYGEKIAVMLREPTVKSCRFAQGKAQLTLGQAGTYLAKYQDGDKETAIKIAGDSLEVPQATKQITLCHTARLSQGPEKTFDVCERSIYALQREKETFYAVCSRPDGWNFDADLVLGLGTALKEAEAYGGTCFNLTAVEGKTEFTIKKEAFQKDCMEVRVDYELLLQKVEQTALLDEIRLAILENMPMRAADMLYYYYRCSFESGRIGIYEGMGLLTEYTVYQNIPGAKQSYRDLSGFVGTGTARYQIVRRDGRLKVDPFSGSMNFIVNPPAAITSENILCGGAGVADLLYTGFSAPYMELVYPAAFSNRDSEGSVYYDENICLMSAANPQKLKEAADSMRGGGIAVDGVACHYFRGRAVVIPQIMADVFGSMMWVSVGTTLGDIRKSCGMGACSLYRNVAGKQLLVVSDQDDIPLVSGDSIKDRGRGL